MYKNTLCRLATLGLMASNAFADDKVIADFEDGPATAFSTTSSGTKNRGDDIMTYTDPKTYYPEEGEDGYFSFSYAWATAMPNDNQEEIFYRINIKDDNGEYYATVPAEELKDPPEFPITECVGGFSYRYKGVAHLFIARTLPNPNWDLLTAKIAASEDWTTATVTPDKLKNNGNLTLNLATVQSLNWVINDKLESDFTQAGSLAIDDIMCLTTEADDGGESPIRLSQIAKGNIHAYTANNAIILQNVPQNAKVEIYNLSGKLISSKSFNQVNQGSDMLRISVQTKGMYFVKVNNQTLRVVVK